MWKRLQLTQDHDWVELDTADQAEALELPADRPDQFILWTGKIPTDNHEAEALVSKVKSLNGGRVSQLVFGRLALEEASSEALCSGKCFCMGGPRRCQYNYCNADNVCWWVDCGSSC